MGVAWAVLEYEGEQLVHVVGCRMSDICFQSMERCTHAASHTKYSRPRLQLAIQIHSVGTEYSHFMGVA
jgi:hypothetical protein